MEHVASRVSALANLLHHEHRRKQLVGLCVKSTPFEWITHLFDYGVIRSATWRWGAVTKILPDILSRKFALQAVWDERRFLSGGHGVNEVWNPQRKCVPTVDTQPNCFKAVFSRFVFPAVASQCFLFVDLACMGASEDP